jgi:hypothetical protein
VGALLTLFPDIPNVEARILSAFDDARDRVLQAAGKRYYSARRKRAFYILAAGDFS